MNYPMGEHTIVIQTFTVPRSYTVYPDISSFCNPPGARFIKSTESIAFLGMHWVNIAPRARGGKLLTWAILFLYIYLF